MTWHAPKETVYKEWNMTFFFFALSYALNDNVVNKPACVEDGMFISSNRVGLHSMQKKVCIASA